jgi:carbamoyl-phosphate synthase large subunit
LVVPTTDPELAVLARYRREFASDGVIVVISDPRFVDMTRDKRMTMSWFRERGLQTPRTINSRADAVFPLLALSCHGNEGARVVTDAAQFSALLLNDPELVFTEYLSPADFERCTVDMYYSEAGTLKGAVPRQGDDDVAAGTALRPTIATLHERFARIPGARGCITMQVAVDRRTQAIYGTQITARLDTGHSYDTDPSFARWLIQDYLLGEGEPVLRRSAA